MLNESRFAEVDVVKFTVYNYLFFNASNRGLPAHKLYTKSVRLMGLIKKGISDNYDFEFNPVVGKFCAVAKRLCDFGFQIDADQFVIRNGRRLHRDHEIIRNIAASLFNGLLTAHHTYTNLHEDIEELPSNSSIPTALDYLAFFHELHTVNDETSINENAIAELDIFLKALGVPKQHHHFLGSIIIALNRHPEMRHEELLEELGLRKADNFGKLARKDIETAAKPTHEGPLPTPDELEASGKLYSQAHAAAREAGRKYSIIEHLRSDPWWPLIQQGQLTRPELLNRDKSAYKGLAVWLAKDGNDLKAELGHDIPSKSIVARAGLTPEAKKEAFRVRSILQRDKAKATASRER